MTDHVHPHDEARGDAHPSRSPGGDSSRRPAWRWPAACCSRAPAAGRSRRSATIPSPPAIDTATPIKRVIYIMLENRSFNNVFGRFPGVRAARRSGVEYGAEKPLIDVPGMAAWRPAARPRRLPQLRERRRAWTGSASARTARPTPTRSSTSIRSRTTGTGPKEYALSDNFFASAAGPTYANHYYFIAGQSGGVIDNPENIATRLETTASGYKSWGCDATATDVFVFVKDAQGQPHEARHLLRFPDGGRATLRESASTGRTTPPSRAARLLLERLQRDRDVFHTRHVARSTCVRWTTIVKDIEANKLPPVTWVTPRFELSDHPPSVDGYSHNWVTDIVNAVMTERRVGAHRDLPDLGRMGRLLRPDRCPRRSTTSAWASGCRC